MGQNWSDVVVFAGACNQAGGNILLIEAFSKHTSAQYAEKSSQSSSEDTKAWTRISVISVNIAIFLCGKCYAHGISLSYKQLKWGSMDIVLSKITPIFWQNRMGELIISKAKWG